MKIPEIRTFSGDTTIRVSRVLYTYFSPQSGVNGEDAYVIHYDNNNEQRISDPTVMKEVMEFFQEIGK